jgi:hypothetical protein
MQRACRWRVALAYTPLRACPTPLLQHTRTNESTRANIHTFSHIGCNPHPLPYAARVNHPPVAASSASIALGAGKGTIVTVPLLGRLPYGPPGAQLPAVFMDADGDALQVEVTTRPDGTQGRLEVDAATGAAVFTPSKKFKKGVVTFFVRAREAASEGLASREATVRIRYGGWQRHRRRARRGLAALAAAPCVRPRPARPNR